MPARRSGGTTGVLGGVLLGGLVNRRLPSTPWLCAPTLEAREVSLWQGRQRQVAVFDFVGHRRKLLRSLGPSAKKGAQGGAIAWCPRRQTMAEELPPFRY